MGLNRCMVAVIVAALFLSGCRGGLRRGRLQRSPRRPALRRRRSANLTR